MRVVAGILLRSRETQAERARCKSEEIEQLKQVNQQQRDLEEADDWAWMADHSNQIGKEKALAMIGVRASHMRKSVVGADERFAEFTSQMSRTRCAIQQTELGQLTPVSPRPKSRFMNLFPRTWVERNLGTTLASKRQTAYAEFKTAA